MSNNSNPHILLNEIFILLWNDFSLIWWVGWEAFSKIYVFTVWHTLECFNVSIFISARSISISVERSIKLMYSWEVGKTHIQQYHLGISSVMSENDIPHWIADYWTSK